MINDVRSPSQNTTLRVFFSGTATLVDYDVCAYNNQGFDISQYLLTSAIGFLAIDRKGEPRTLNTPEFYKEFLKSYLETLSKVNEWGRDVTENDIQRLYAQVQKMTLVSFKSENLILML
jgi:hypothetical protein